MVTENRDKRWYRFCILHRGMKRAIEIKIKGE